MTARCLFCGGDSSEPDHFAHCDGRQGHREAVAPILDATLSEQLKASGMAQVEEGAGAEFRDLALDAVFQVASFRSEFVSDDVWVALDGQAAGADNRALGPVMRRAQSLGWIAPTGSFVLTAQARRHRSPVRVWRSLIAEVV